MKLDPGFITHWKTERLLDELGGDGVVALLRLWGQAQIRREWRGLKFTPKRLKMETKWKGDENHLFAIFTDPEAPWLDQDEDGSFSIHGFEEHQKQVIHLWKQGPKGGRPSKKVPPAPSSKNEDEEKKEDSYSSSYPQCEPFDKPNGNHMVLDAAESKPLCTLAQAIAQAPTSRMSVAEAEFWWHTRNGSGWTKGTNGGGAPRKITSWQSDMQTSASWIKEAMTKNQKPARNIDTNGEQLEMPDA